MSHILLTIVFLKLIYIFVCRKKSSLFKKKSPIEVFTVTYAWNRL